MVADLKPTTSTTSMRMAATAKVERSSEWIKTARFNLCVYRKSAFHVNAQIG